MFGIGPTHGNPEIGAGRQIYRIGPGGQVNRNRGLGGVYLNFDMTVQFNIRQINFDIGLQGTRHTRAGNDKEAAAVSDTNDGCGPAQLDVDIVGT